MCSLCSLGGGWWRGVTWGRGGAGGVHGAAEALRREWLRWRRIVSVSESVSESVSVSVSVSASFSVSVSDGVRHRRRRKAQAQAQALVEAQAQAQAQGSPREGRRRPCPR